MSTTQELIERLRDVAEWKKIIEQHRRKTDDPEITYILKDGTRVHEDDSIVAKLAASLSRALEGASDTATEAADRLASLEAENAALKAKLAGVDENALEAGYTRLQQYADFPLEFPPDETFRAAITAYLAAGRDGE